MVNFLCLSTRHLLSWYSVSQIHTQSSLISSLRSLPKKPLWKNFSPNFLSHIHTQDYYLSSAYGCVCVKCPQEFRWISTLVTIITSLAYKRWPGMYQELGNICVYINFYEYTELNTFFPKFLRWRNWGWQNSVLLRVLQGERQTCLKPMKEFLDGSNPKDIFQAIWTWWRKSLTQNPMGVKGTHRKILVVNRRY